MISVAKRKKMTVFSEPKLNAWENFNKKVLRRVKIHFLINFKWVIMEDGGGALMNILEKTL